MSTRNRNRSPALRIASDEQRRTDEPTQASQNCQEEQPNMEQHPIDSSVINNVGTSKKKGRGKTTGTSVEKERLKSGNGKLSVIIHPIRKRIVGSNAKHFKTEATAVIKLHAPLKFARWKQIPIDIKKKMWLAMKQKFNLAENDQVMNRVFEQLNRQYRSYRHNLHVHYLENKDNVQNLQTPPDSVSEDDWLLLMAYFESEEFKEVSDRNKKNREKLVMGHTCGTKSIAQYCYEGRDVATEKEPSRTSTWRKTRFSNKKNDWVDKDSREAYENIIRLQSEPTEDNQFPMSEDEAFIAVLGPEKPSRLRGCGDGLKPPSKRGQGINDELQNENEELRKKNEETSLRLQTLEAQLTNHEAQVQAQVKAQVEAQVQAILKSQLPALLQNLSQTSQGPSSNV